MEDIRSTALIEDYHLYIFTDNSVEMNDKILLLQQESELIKNFTLHKLDTDSTEAYRLKKIFHCPNAGMAALADKNHCFIVRMSIPRSFFELRSWLLVLGYRREANAIQWNTDG